MNVASSSHCSITRIASPHIGPAIPDPEALAMKEPPTVWPAEGIGWPSWLAPAIIAAVGEVRGVADEPHRLAVLGGAGLAGVRLDASMIAEPNPPGAMTPLRMSLTVLATFASSTWVHWEGYSLSRFPAASSIAVTAREAQCLPWAAKVA